MAATQWDDERARERVARAEELLSGLDSLPDSAAAARAAETVETLVGLYGECLARIMDQLTREEDAAGPREDAEGGAVRRLADDELVAHLLLVHDLHPDPPETRLRRGLDALRPHLRSLGTELEVLELSATGVRIRLAGGGRGCSSAPAEPPDQAVRDAVAGCAPEIETVEIETAPAAAPETLIPVDALFRRPAPAGRGTG